MLKTLRFLWDHPLHRRVSLMTTVAVALTGVVFSLAGYVALRSTLIHTSQDLALTVAGDLAGPATRDLQTTGALSDGLEQAGRVVVEAVDDRGQVRRTPGETLDLVVDPVDLTAAGAGGVTVRRTGTTTSGERFAIVAVPLPGTGHALLVGRSLDPVLEILRVQRLILLAVGLAGALAAAVAGAVVGLSAQRPMRQLTEAVEHVTETGDYQAVSVRFAKGDIVRLAASFNLMLLSLTRARERQSRLVADAGHELRTPLTSLRTNVDLLAVDVRRDVLSLDARTAVLGDVQSQLGELADMIGDLVHVAREDTELLLEVLDVREIAETALARVRNRAQGTTFTVDLAPVFVVGNAESLRRAVTNLLDNAVKWSPPGGVVRVELEGNRLRVADAGPGIAEADLPYVFDRFFRGGSARGTKGTGLGLSIVAKTMEEIGGTVEAGRSTEGGALFTLQLPGVTTREAVPHLLVPTG